MNEKTKKIICLRCPKGCEITVTEKASGELDIKGNACMLGLAYAENEIRNPVRTLTTSVRVEGGEYPLVPVWTPSPMPKVLLGELNKELRKITLRAPVKRGEAVIRDWRGLGVNVETSGECGRKNETSN